MDSEVDQELAEWQSSESHDQCSRVQQEACSQCIPRDQYWDQSYSSGIWRKGSNTPFSKFAGGTKLEELADPPEGSAAIPWHLDQLEDWAERNLMRLNQGKCWVLHLGRNSPKCQHRLGLTSCRAALWKRTWDS
ncbi:hypothetical protein HGM15179_013341 [Zosterops borbonicus]|uniref:Uncharacterized protein n=1 Tax=Zosterops borbonicus TaxID=364589 RepID=A0A8K1G8K0_9PASS|nr:hypothetical protein HGM15179_013341 [Zosterops borbonicus]